GRGAGLGRGVAQLEDRPHLAAGLGDEAERHDDLRAHLADELLDAGVPLRILRRLAADALALGEVLVRPHVDDLVERPDLRVPEREQLRVLLAVLVRLAETLLDLGQAAWSDLIGADLVDHAVSFRNASSPHPRTPHESAKPTGAPAQRQPVDGIGLWTRSESLGSLEWPRRWDSRTSRAWFRDRRASFVPSRFSSIAAPSTACCHRRTGARSS